MFDFGKCSSQLVAAGFEPQLCLGIVSREAARRASIVSVCRKGKLVNVVIES